MPKYKIDRMKNTNFQPWRLFDPHGLLIGSYNTHPEAILAVDLDHGRRHYRNHA